MTFVPGRVFFERDALKYPLGEKLYRQFTGEGIPVSLAASHKLW